jgi:hypothetical protein
MVTLLHIPPSQTISEYSILPPPASLFTLHSHDHLPRNPPIALLLNLTPLHPSFFINDPFRRPEPSTSYRKTTRPHRLFLRDVYRHAYERGTEGKGQGVDQERREKEERGEDEEE